MERGPLEITFTIDIKPGEKLSLPESLVNGVGPGRWCVSLRPCDAGNEDVPTRCHDAFLSSYALQDEALYDDLGR